MKRTRRIAALTSLMIAAACGTWANAAELYGRVVGVTDGDTITVLDDTRKPHTIRLANIDSPETSCHKKIGNDDACIERGQSFGKVAKRNLSAMVFGKDVVVDVLPGSTYGREIGTVYLVNGNNKLDVNYMQVAAGYAWHYTQYAEKQQPRDIFIQYQIGESTARQKGVGLWSDASPEEPWEYRHRVRASAASYRGPN